MSGPADALSEDPELLAAWHEWGDGWGRVVLYAHDLADLRRVLDAHGFAIVRRLKAPAVID